MKLVSDTEGIMWNKYKHIIIFVVGFLLGIFAMYKIQDGGEIERIVTIKVPAVEGKSDTIYKFKPYTILQNKDSIVFKDSVIHTENPFNKELAQNYIDLDKRFAGIELEKKKLEEYLKSIETNEYKIPFDDKNVSITNNIKTQGKLISFQQDYLIKEKEIKVSVPENKKVNLYGGAEIGNNKDFNSFVAKGNLYLQVPKGDMINVSYDTDNRIWVGYAFKF